MSKGGAALPHLDSAKAVFPFDLVFCQATDSGQGTATVRHGHCDENLVRSRRVVHTNFHAIEVATHESCVFVAQGYVERGAGTATLFRGGNERRAFAEYFSYRRAELGV